MTHDIARHQSSPSVAFARHVQGLAGTFLKGLATDERAQKAAGALALALRTAAASNPKIYDCDPQSVAECVAMSALSGLNPGGPLPDVYLIPRRIKGTQRLQWQASYRGLMTLASRAGYRIQAVPVYRSEEFSLLGGERAGIHHLRDPDIEANFDQLRGVYVQATRLVDGQYMGYEWLNIKGIEERRERSDSWKKYKSGPWIDWPVEMAMKTAIRYAISRGLVSLDEGGLIAYEHDGKADASPAPMMQAQAQPVGRTGSSALADALNGTPTTPEPPPVIEAAAATEVVNPETGEIVEVEPEVETGPMSDEEKAAIEAAERDAAKQEGLL